jgi:LmbE family N-acetylglucosaminyl deacetylase
MNVVFIGAHPDDEMFCLGTLLLCRQRGDHLFLVCATNGDKGISDDPDFCEGRRESAAGGGAE